MSRLPGEGAEGFRTLRRYGQNFLVDRGVLEDIVRWNYDVHVYPKNSVAGIEKTVDDSIVQAKYNGDDVK